MLLIFVLTFYHSSDNHEIKKTHMITSLLNKTNEMIMKIKSINKILKRQINIFFINLCEGIKLIYSFIFIID